MKLHLQQGEEGLYVIQAVEPGCVTINDTAYTRSLIVSSARILANWPPPDFASLEAGHLSLILPLQPDIILLGTGAKQRFPEAALLRDIVDAKIGLEIMDTAAACRTYNVLLSEGRNVAAALIIEPSSA